MLAGYAAEGIVQNLRRLLDKLPEKLKRILRPDRLVRLAPLFTVLTVAVIVVVGWQENYKKVMRLGRLGGSTWADITAGEKWLSEQEKGPPGPGSCTSPASAAWRAAWSPRSATRSTTGTSSDSAPVRTDLPKLKFGYEATAIFKNVPLAHRWPYDTELIQQLLTNPDALTNLHVRWVFSLVEWPDRDDLTLVKRFGKVWLYEVEGGHGSAGPPGGPRRAQGALVLGRAGGGEGGGRGRDLADPLPHRLLLPLAGTARRRGSPPRAPRGACPHARKILMAAPAKDGVTRLIYDRPPWEKAANRISLAGWILSVLFLLGVGVPRFRRRRR